jgi:NAD(P)-dependent dehydrogenase (short-subunit alcohol dehydrogenase family)
MLQDLTKKIAIVTGGASGIGLASCHQLMDLGVMVNIVDIDNHKVDLAVAELRERFPGLHVQGLVADLSQEMQVDGMVNEVLAAQGRIDMLVHCAGILRLPGSAPKILPELSVEEYDFVIGTNLRGTFLVNRAVLPAMIRQRAGQILNLSSTSGIKGRALDSVYCASKFGVVGLTESLADEVRQFGIRVQVVSPDAVKTPFWDQNGPVPVPDWALPPERVASLITYMLSLPEDSMLANVIISPVRTRRRKRKQK